MEMRNHLVLVYNESVADRLGKELCEKYIQELEFVGFRDNVLLEGKQIFLENPSPNIKSKSCLLTEENITTLIWIFK